MRNLWRVSATEVKNSWGRVVRRILLVAERAAETHKQQQLILLDEAERFAKEVAARYPDHPSPDSVEILREMREERDGELTP